MEDGRAQVNLGQAIDAELQAVPEETPKQPKKRFIGRRAAAERAEQKTSANANIEESSAVQGSYPCSSVKDRR